MPQKLIPPIVSWIFFAVVIFLAQRDLGRRAPGAMRGSKRMWRIVAAFPPGAIAYLIFGRKKRAENGELASVTIEPA